VYANRNNKARIGRSKKSKTAILKRSQDLPDAYFISPVDSNTAPPVYDATRHRNQEQQIEWGDRVYVNHNNKVRIGHSKKSKTAILKRRSGPT